MRIDKFLKVSRLVKRRTIANKLCDSGKVIINGREAKASYDVKVGDTIEIRAGGKLRRVEVANISEVVRKEEAPGLYRDIEGVD